MDREDMWRRDIDRWIADNNLDIFFKELRLAGCVVRYSPPDVGDCIILIDLIDEAPYPWRMAVWPSWDGRFALLQSNIALPSYEYRPIEKLVNSREELIEHIQAAISGTEDWSAYTRV